MLDRHMIVNGCSVVGVMFRQSVVWLDFFLEELSRDRGPRAVINGVKLHTS